MENSNETAVVLGEDGYPFADLPILRSEAGAFMHRILDEDLDDDRMDVSPHHIITPDNAWFTSSQPTPRHDPRHRHVVCVDRQPLEAQDSNNSVQIHRQIWIRDSKKREPSPHTGWNSRQTRMALDLTTTAQQGHHQPNSFEARKHQIHHNRNQHNHPGATALNPMASKAPQGEPASRQRTSPARKSRSIQIKRSRRGSENEFAASSMTASSAEQMYDWATWRMYHRITSARRVKSSVSPLPGAGNASSYQETVAGSRTYRGISGFPKEATGREGSSASPSPQKQPVTQADRNDFDEGIFVMDL